MAHVRLVPGTNTEMTPTLNTAGVVSSQGVRWWQGLPQKQGGWVNYYTGTTFNPPPRDMMPLESLSGANPTLVIANDRVRFLSSGTLTDVSPVYTSGSINRTSLTVDIAAGSSLVQINWSGHTFEAGDIITFDTVVGVGADGSLKGGYLFGSYEILTATGTYIIVDCAKVYQNPVVGGAVFPPTMRVFSGSNLLLIVMQGFPKVQPGDILRFTYPTTLGGLTVVGDLTVSQTSDPPTSAAFSVRLPSNATSNGNTYQSGGIIYYTVAKPLALTPVAGTTQTSPYWTLSPWGAAAVATAVGGRTYSSSLNGGPMVPVAGSPVYSAGSFIAMPQQILVCWGASTGNILDPLTLRWSDVSNYNDWTASSIDQAGSFRISRGNRIVGCLQASQQAFIWTETDTWVMQYVGTPLVFGFNLIGAGSGLIARRAVGALNADIFWMGKDQFYVMSNGNIRPMKCTVWDAVYQNLNTSQAALDKIFCAPNIGFNEVGWYYCSAGSSEVDSRVIYNLENNAWTYETGPQVTRYAWLDRSVLGPPLASAPGTSNSIIIQNEIGYKAGTSQLTSKFKTGYWMVNESQNAGFVDMIYPDFIFGTFSGSKDVTLNIKFYSKMNLNDAETVHGPFSYPNSKNFLSTRIRGRYVAMEVEEIDSATDSFWRLGDIRFRVAQDGRQ